MTEGMLEESSMSQLTSFSPPLGQMAWMALEGEPTNRTDVEGEEEEEEVLRAAPPSFAALFPDGKPKEPKRPTSGYFLYMADVRVQYKKEHPSAGVAEMGKALGDRWKAMTDAEKQKYNDHAAAEKELYKKIMLTYKLELDKYENMKKQLRSADAEEDGDAASDADGNGAGGSDDESGDGGSTFALPVARVKKVMQLDDSVKNLSKDSILHVTKLTEEFIAVFGKALHNLAKVQQRKTIKVSDIASTVRGDRKYYFLRHALEKDVAAAEKEALEAKKRREQQLAEQQQVRAVALEANSAGEDLDDEEREALQKKKDAASIGSLFKKMGATSSSSVSLSHFTSFAGDAATASSSSPSSATSRGRSRASKRGKNDKTGDDKDEEGVEEEVDVIDGEGKKKGKGRTGAKVAPTSKFYEQMRQLGQAQEQARRRAEEHHEYEEEEADKVKRKTKVTAAKKRKRLLGDDDENDENKSNSNNNDEGDDNEDVDDGDNINSRNISKATKKASKRRTISSDDDNVDGEEDSDTTTTITNNNNQKRSNDDSDGDDLDRMNAFAFKAR